MNQYKCIRCGSICESDYSSGMILPPWKDGFGHMCHTDKTLHCIFFGDKDRLENELVCCEQRFNHWYKKAQKQEKEIEELQNELEAWRNRGSEI